MRKEQIESKVYYMPPAGVQAPSPAPLQPALATVKLPPPSQTISDEDVVREVALHAASRSLGRAEASAFFQFLVRALRPRRSGAVATAANASC